jgi:hypothetical protein
VFKNASRKIVMLVTVALLGAAAPSSASGFNIGGGMTYPLDEMLVRGDFRVFKHIDDVPTAARVTGQID